MQNVEDESMAALTKFAKGTTNKVKVKHNKFSSIYIETMPKPKSHSVLHDCDSSSSSGEETVEGSEDFSKMMKKIVEKESDEEYDLNDNSQASSIRGGNIVLQRVNDL